MQSIFSVCKKCSQRGMWDMLLNEKNITGAQAVSAAAVHKRRIVTIIEGACQHPLFI